MLGLWSIKFFPMRNIPRPSVSSPPDVHVATSVNGVADQLTYRQDLGLQVLDNVIMTRWKVLPREQCQGSSIFLAAVAQVVG